MSLTVQQINRPVGMRRAQSVSICDNTQRNTQSRISLNRPPPITAATSPRTLEIATNTSVHLDPNEIWKNGN
ncbi:unnamed protein product [Rotaria magnacalcarata]